MKKLIIFESILITFFILSWNVSNSDENFPPNIKLTEENLNLFCDVLILDMRGNINSLVDRVDRAEIIFNAEDKSFYLEEIMEMEKESTKDFINIHRSSQIWHNVCQGSKLFDKLRDN